MCKTEIIKISHTQAVERAKQIIHQDGTIAFPTDTVYGIAANAFSPVGIQKIYNAKGRSSEKALPVLIGNFEQLVLLVSEISDWVRKIAEMFWPGALTIVLPKVPQLPSELTPYPTVGVRMPDLDFTRQLLQQTGPLATTSANLSGMPNAITAQDVLNQLDGRVDLILDGGPTPGSFPSTVIDITGPEIKVLREGPISLEMIIAVLNQEK